MTVLITLTVYGSDTGPFFDLYSNIDGYAVAFEQGVSKTDLIAGYVATTVPDFAITIRVESTGECTNYVDIAVEPTTTTSTTTAITLYDAFNVRLTDVALDHCAEQFEEVYVAVGETITTGITVYSDTDLTTPVSGNYISEENAGIIYNIAIGLVGAPTGDSC